MSGDDSTMRIYCACTKKAAASLLALIGAAVLLISVVIAASAYGIGLPKNETLKGRETVIIDPGHGEPDGGAVGADGVIEKNINLSISQKLKNLFLVAGYAVIMTREDDNAIYDKGSKTIRQKKNTDLHNRLAIINAHPEAIFISIHQNISTSSKTSGSLALYSPNNEDSKTLAQLIQTHIVKLLQPENKKAIAPARKTLYLMNQAKSPAVIVECGFLSNPSECKLLQDDVYQNKMAFAIYCGALEFEDSSDSISNHGTG